MNPHKWALPNLSAMIYQYQIAPSKQSNYFALFSGTHIVYHWYLFDTFFISPSYFNNSKKRFLNVQDKS